MPFFPVPDILCRRVSELTPKRLRQLGVRAVICDLDNTISAYKGEKPTEFAALWLDSLKTEGIAVGVVSNNDRKRVADFCAPLEVEFIWKAAKPSRRGLLELADRLGVQPENCLAVGDQIYTDVFAGRRCGMKTALVRPISLFQKPLYMLRRVGEAPFIAIAALRRKVRTK